MSNKTRLKSKPIKGDERGVVTEHNMWFWAGFWNREKQFL